MKKKSNGAHPRKAILPATVSLSRELASIGDERWSRIRAHLPETLTAEKDDQLRRAILTCCSAYQTSHSHLKKGAGTALAMRRPGKGQLALLERLAHGLRISADAWAKIGDIYDDRLSDISIFDGVETLARDAERRVTGIRTLGAPTELESPWPAFICSVARSCRRAGLNPTATGRTYENAKPTWFQLLIRALRDDLLGDEAGGRHSDTALYAEVAKALRGDGKAGKPADKSPDR